MLTPLQQSIYTVLADPAIAGLSDAAAAGLLSAPIYTPRPDRITITSLSASSVWGFSKASLFRQALATAAAAGNADAATLLSILTGPGFDATDPQSANLAPGFVALSNGAIQSADATTALNVTTYRCGAIVAAADVTAARSQAAYDAAALTLRQQFTQHCTAGVGLIDAAARTGSTLPTMDQLRQA